MDVTGIGDVAEFCQKRGMTVTERYEGDPLLYRGPGKTIVWGGYHKMFEFYYVKFKLLRRGIGLLSVQDYGDMGAVLEQFVAYLARRERDAAGRPPFGWRREEGGLVPVPEELRLADEILLLHSGGCSYREIAQRLRAEGKTRPDGVSVSVSTVTRVCKRKELYQT